MAVVPSKISKEQKEPLKNKGSIKGINKGTMQVCPHFRCSQSPERLLIATPRSQLLELNTYIKESSYYVVQASQFRSIVVF